LRAEVNAREAKKKKNTEFEDLPETDDHVEIRGTELEELVATAASSQNSATQSSRTWRWGKKIFGWR
jgi:hypothetical protein